MKAALPVVNVISRCRGGLCDPDRMSPGLLFRKQCFGFIPAMWRIQVSPARTMIRRVVIAWCTVGFAAGLVLAGDEPELPYYDWGACPFECCTYREWIAK